MCQQTDGDDAQLVVNIAHSPSSTSVIEIDDNNDNNDCKTHILVDDPALWPKGRRFTKAYYYIVMKNGERVNRSWLVYSESADRVFCFCCCLSGKQKQLSEEGFKD